MVKRSIRSKDSGVGAASVETTSTEGGNPIFNKPQEIVDVEDASSVISGISVPDEMEEEKIEIPDVIAKGPSEQQPESALPTGSSTGAEAHSQPASSLSLMSPPGKAAKKVKKLSLLKKNKTASSTNVILTASAEESAVKEAIMEKDNDNENENEKATAKCGKVKVLKSSKSLGLRKQTATSDEPGPSISGSETKSNKKLVKMKSSKKSSADAVDDDRSVKSSGGNRPKSVKNKSGNDLCSQSLSSFFEKETLNGSTPKEMEDRSTSSGIKKKKTKSLSSSSHSRGAKGTNDEERSVRSGTKKVKRARSKSRERVKSPTRDDKSVDSIRSRSVRSGRKKADAPSLDTEIRMSATGPSVDKQYQETFRDTAIVGLERENQALLQELSVLRRQLCEAEQEKKHCCDHDQAEMDEMREELKTALSETIELKQELDECEGALEEKDRLIKKLTDAVDAQLDKVEYLELKLQRAEEEFCNMEDEMKEMEDIIDEMKKEMASKVESDSSTSPDVVETVENGNNAAPKRFQDLEGILSELSKENDRLNKYTKHLLAKEQAMHEQRDEEIKTIQIGINKQLQELDDENESLRQKIEEITKDQKSHEEGLQQQLEELRKENTRLELALQRPDRIEGGGLSQDYVYELEVEIADLRDKIVEHEDHSRRQKEEIALVFIENEEVKQDLQEREIELRDLEAQFSETKATSAKKLKQKDETISFMQTEMMRIMQEKQKVDKLLRGKRLDASENGFVSSSHKKGVDEEAEKARLQAINDQLRQLDEENQALEEKLKEAHYNHSLRLKEKQGIILDLQEELNDAKWELGARKEGADYITLLKDRKERKRDLDQTKKELKKANERILDLEREMSDLVSHKQDLEKEVESLNNSVLSMDSGEYVNGLKRQIKSLKQHNIALERKVQIEVRDAEEKFRTQDAKIRILEHELEKLRNPTRAALKSVFYSFGRKDEEFDQQEADGERQKNVDAEHLTETDDNNSSSNHNITGGDQTEKEKRGGSIWTLFSPRKSTDKTSKRASFSRLSWETKSSTVSNNEIHDGEVMEEIRAGMKKTDDIDRKCEERSQAIGSKLTEAHQGCDSTVIGGNEPVKVGKAEECISHSIDGQNQATGEKVDLANEATSASYVGKMDGGESVEVDRDALVIQESSGNHADPHSNTDSNNDSTTDSENDSAAKDKFELEGNESLVPHMLQDASSPEESTREKIMVRV